MKGKVLFIHGVTEIGGAERELLLILERLQRRKIECAVVCSGHGRLTQELRHRSIPLAIAPLPPWRKASSFLQRGSAIHELREVLRSIKPTLIHVNDIWWVPQVLRAAKDLAIPKLAHVRQEIEANKVVQYQLGRTDCVLAVSRQIARSLQAAGVKESGIEILYSGIDCFSKSAQNASTMREQLGLPPDALVLGTVANLFPRKGYDVMLKALPRIVAAFPHVYYLMIGKGDDSWGHKLRRLSSKLAIADHVRFLGFQERVDPFLAILDLYVHPAVMEGFGIAVLEAMAAGNAIVATRVGGIPEIVADHVTGLLVQPNDADGLASAIIELLHDPSRRSQYAIEGRKRAETSFSIDAMMRKLLDVYRKVTNDKFVPVTTIP